MTAWIVLGPAEHGVVMLAERICSELPDCGTPPVVRAGGIADLLGSCRLSQALTAGKGAHVHFTDRLFGSDCHTAAAAFAELAATVGKHHGELSVTLHDLPMRCDDTDRFQRRASAYQHVIASTTGRVIVSSAHEADLVTDIARHARPIVIPLPIDAGQPLDRGAACASPDVTILGFLYPGNGHAEVLEALPALPAGIGLTALGRVADGHQDVTEELTLRARELGRSFAVTGWIAADALPPALRQAAIPVVGPRPISASSSIGAWLSAGRRPIVPDLPYTRELLTRIPDAVTPYSLDGLAAALRRAHADPDSTWLPADVRLGPSTQTVAAAYLSACEP